MRNPERDRVERLTLKAERSLAALAGALVLLLAVYVIGMSGIPGEAFTAMIDWAVQRGFVQPQGPGMQVGLSAFLM